MMNDIMQNDEKVDELSSIEVKDAYVRMKFMKTMMQYYGNRPNGFSNPNFREAENTLNNMTREGIRLWAIKMANKGIFTKQVGEIGHQNRSEDFIIKVFDRITNDDFSDEKCVRIARKSLKKQLQGSMGMPDDRVVREYLKE